MNSVSIPNKVEDLIGILQDFVRRAIDGTTIPLFVDYTNNRVIIGGIESSSSPATFEIATGDIKVVTAGKGIILSSRDGTKYYRLVVDNDGALSVDQL